MFCDPGIVVGSATTAVGLSVPTGHLPFGGYVTRMHFTKDPECVAVCRDFVVQTLGPRPVELVDRAVLVASELVTNVIRHTSNGGTLEVIFGSDQLRLEVSDFSH